MTRDCLSRACRGRTLPPRTHRRTKPTRLASSWPTCLSQGLATCPSASRQRSAITMRTRSASLKRETRPQSLLALMRNHLPRWEDNRLSTSPARSSQRATVASSEEAATKRSPSTRLISRCCKANRSRTSAAWPRSSARRTGRRPGARSECSGSGRLRLLQRARLVRA